MRRCNSQRQHSQRNQATALSWPSSPWFWSIFSAWNPSHPGFYINRISSVRSPPHPAIYSIVSATMSALFSMHGAPHILEFKVFSQCTELPKSWNSQYFQRTPILEFTLFSAHGVPHVPQFYNHFSAWIPPHPAIHSPTHPGISNVPIGRRPLLCPKGWSWQGTDTMTGYGTPSLRKRHLHNNLLKIYFWQNSNLHANIFWKLKRLHCHKEIHFRNIYLDC